VSEYDGLDAMVERMAREEQDDIERKHGEHILAATKDARQRQGSAGDPLLEVLRQAHQAKAEADKQ
jgi:hypothetical protein